MDNERPGLVCMRRRCLAALADDAELLLCAVCKCMCMCVCMVAWRKSCNGALLVCEFLADISPFSTNSMLALNQDSRYAIESRPSHKCSTRNV